MGFGRLPLIAARLTCKKKRVAKFRRESNNPIGTAIIHIPGKKKELVIKNREVFETEEKKVIDLLRKDEVLEEIGESKKKK